MRASAPAGVAPPPPRRSRPAFPAAARGAGALPPLSLPGGPHGVLPGNQLPAPQQRALPRHQRRLQGTALQEGRSLAGNCHLLAPPLTCLPHGRSGAGGWVGARGCSRSGAAGAARPAGGGVGPLGARCVGAGLVPLCGAAGVGAASPDGSEKFLRRRSPAWGRGDRAGEAVLARRGGAEGWPFSCGSPLTASRGCADRKVNFDPLQESWRLLE